MFLIIRKNYFLKIQTVEKSEQLLPFKRWFAHVFKMSH